MDCSKHKGHIYYMGGKMDGEVEHLTKAHPTDYPMFFGTLLRNGIRNWYEIDYEKSEGTEVYYKFVGLGRNIEDAQS